MTTKISFQRVFASILILSTFIAGFKIISFNEPKISLEGYQIEDGFELSVIASESLLKAPVSMDFDNKGRMWVVEMIGYMPNLEGIGEDEPNGRISILEDRDKNGIIDHSKVFLDKLVLPRAMALVYGGLLYTDGPKLWFVEIKNDKPGKKTLVDPIYAEGGNVEHSSNGLMMNIDNWIYNANYNFRYQLKNGKWLKEPTTNRGQWGITHDNFGRLYYNNNSVQLQGDFVLPNKVIRNKYFKPLIAEGQKLSNNRVFPIHQTSVNRGYQKDVLDEKGYLTNVTASCGPLIYRGGAFPNAYHQNAFVCVPEANLIKRNTLTFNSTQTTANQAIAEKEFIASTDEGFRPVNLFNGPDGAMYIVDMHRGIIQHKAYISQYLTEELSKKKLDTLQNAGRILKVVNKSTKLHPIPDLSKVNSKDLLVLLSHHNGWLRDRAQQLLIQKKDISIVKDLVALTQINNDYSTAIHALYVLDGLNALSFKIISDVLTKSKQPETLAHALVLTEHFAHTTNLAKIKLIFKDLQSQNNETIDLYLAICLNSWLKTGDTSLLSNLAQIEKKYADKQVFQEAIVSSLDGKEEQYLNTQNPSALLKNNLTLAISNRQKKELNLIFVKEKNAVDNRTKGLQLFRSICATCHGADGKGIQDLAPPLKDSEYINGSMKRLASIILHGLSGPITVNGKQYLLNNEMPGLANNKDISDQDIADIIRFTQNAFAKDGKNIAASEVKKLRDKKPLGGGVFSEKQLLETDFEK
ncbi:membrane-bound dehydrogenase domain protein [Emticicia oligotrophica DSM 17448]|uniref:Membrane-bound dehydrogenase domain protein n=1 Tax=Emticicia oligotrophica (strain DSM 17448 / CIP 109782 / MTCC 6937 / GPTSA100-15) TaxID=929562 RepID=A0ABM5N4R0_EMTOG|nr:c-type cytochrome [Emticicia oligotrophica]AFK04435.1 membrane-bound dehydrogenase domain protein [Emticicia oligotrophica DSM 17448]